MEKIEEEMVREEEGGKLREMQDTYTFEPHTDHVCAFLPNKGKHAAGSGKIHKNTLYVTEQ